MNALFSWMKRERVIMMIAAATLLVSLVYAFGYHIRPAVDASAYDIIGTHIAEGKGFRLTLGVPIEQDEVITYQGPLYEFILGGVYAVVGHHVEAVWILHALLRAATVLLIFLTCRRIFPDVRDRRIGWIAGAFVGFYPDLIEIGSMLMSETVFIFLSALVIYLFFRRFKHPELLTTVALAGAFSAAILTRSVIILFSPVFLVWFLRRKVYGQLVIFGVACGLVLTPWAVRNYVTYHKFIPTMANFGYNFWVGNRVGGDGEGGNPPELFQAQQQYGMIGANYYAMDQYKTFVREHPFTYAELTLSRTLKYFSFLRPMGFWFYQSGIPQLLFVASSASAAALLFAFGFAGVFAAWMKDREISELKYLTAFSVVTVLSLVPIIYETRYRMPIYPFMAIFAGYVLSRWLQERSAYKPYVLRGALLAFAIAAVDASLESAKVLAKIREIFSR